MISMKFEAIDIQPWPATSEFTSVSSLMPMDSVWPEDDEHQLAWDPIELSIYMNPAYGDDQRLLLPHDKAPAALHSWGHVARLRMSQSLQ